jgi:hypothetical protein
MEKCSQCGADTESLIEGVPKCPNCSEQNEVVGQKASESEHATTKILSNTAEIVGR